MVTKMKDNITIAIGLISLIILLTFTIIHAKLHLDLIIAKIGLIMIGIPICILLVIDYCRKERKWETKA